MQLRLPRCLAAGAALAIAAAPLSSAGADAGDKALRGLAALAVPFVEIPGNIVHASDEHGAFFGWTEGLARGLGMSIIRPPVGFYELVTAPFETPPRYEPILQPEYPWSYFDDDYQGDLALDTAQRQRWPWSR